VPAGPEPETAAGEIILAAGDENWYPFDQNWTLVNGAVYAIAVDGTNVYVGGDFTWAGQNTNCRHIARWNTVSGLWEPLSGGLDGTVYAIAVRGTDVFAGGAFTGHISVFHNGTGFWQNIGANGIVYALAVSGTDVYAGGYFTTPASHIAKWNGSAWSALGTGVNDGVFALAASGTDIYVGGDFTQAGGASANYIAKWNGSAWSPLGSGLNEYADAISVSGSDVYVGGNFTLAGDSPANYAAKWNGTGWSALGSGLNWHFPSVGGSAIAANGLDVFVGGVFTQAGATLANYIAKWNGSSWGALGSGLNNMVSAIAVSGTSVYVGGQFTTAGGKQSYYLARWVEPLAVVSPNGGESWDAGSSHAVTWTVDATLGPMKIEYSTNNGATWTTVVASTPNTGTYAWTLPNMPSASCRIRISEAADGDPADSSDGLFTIAGIRVTSPNGGEQLIVGSQHTITWVTAGGYPTVKIELSQNGGSVWETITASTANTGSYLWTVPAAIFSQGLVRVSDSADGVPADASDAVFSTIAVPFIQVTRPNGGEVWEPGWAVHIYYNDNITENFVKIELSADGGSYWTTLTNFAVSNGIYSWTVTNSPSTACLVRISGSSSGTPVDTSDGPFTITGFQVTAPNGVQLEPGDPQTITWNTIGSYPNVKIEFSANSGSTWETVTASTANTGSFPWTVPEVTTYQAVIRVSDAADGVPYGQGGFSIVEPPPPPSIQVLSPNGGEMWLAGSSHDITWTSTGISGWMRIFYSTDNGLTFTQIAMSLNDGTYTWTVPSTVSSACLVRIIDLNALAPADTSDAVFSIVGEPTIAVTSPNGGESWTPGSTRDITWTSAGIAGTVTIDLYKGGVYQDRLAIVDVADGTLSWLIAMDTTPGTDYRILIYQEGFSDESDADFAIAAPAFKQEDFVGTWDGQGVYYRDSDTGAFVKLASPATMIATGDLDGDGIDDLIGLWPGQGGIWVKYSQSGAWARLSSTAVHIAAGDMNGDGRVDLLGTWDGQGVYYRNSISGAWVKLASPATLITTGDIDGDGIDDLVGIWPTQGGVWVKYSSTGLWARLSSTARDIAAGDMNGDGRDDLLATWDGQGVYYRDSISGAWVKMASEATQVTCGDLDADGTADLIGIWPTQGGVWVKYSEAGIWARLSSTAVDITAGVMRAQGMAGAAADMAEGVMMAAGRTLEELPLPMGGSEEGPGIAPAKRDHSALGPGGTRFVYLEDLNLDPAEDPAAALTRLPGPGEPGFVAADQKNQIPAEQPESRKERKGKQK
jgi:hypothetical protein